MKSAVSRFLVFGGLACALSMTWGASAKVRKDGAWPDQEKKISLDGDGAARDAAVRELATKAGWSLILPWKDKEHRIVGSDRIDVHVKDEPADKVLEMLLMDGSYVATREGNRVVLSLESASTSP